MQWFMTIVLWFAAAVGAVAPGPTFWVDLQKAGDQVLMTSSRNSAAISITSGSGIGGAVMVRTGKKWPDRITIRLNLKNLESFDMENGIIRFHTSIRTSGKSPYWRVDRAGEPAASPANTPDGTLEVSMGQSDEAVMIAVPKEMLEGNPEKISFGWIDEFRN
ncbi:MAG: hypothetical protein C4518_20290 [Desulfobacteraceae bacterium]|nr:MAG: hypothetical protein C4518_20290 [Desulfobacteraceae bacterium]